MDLCAGRILRTHCRRQQNPEIGSASAHRVAISMTSNPNTPGVGLRLAHLAEAVATRPSAGRPEVHPENFLSKSTCRRTTYRTVGVPSHRALFSEAPVMTGGGRGRVFWMRSAMAPSETGLFKTIVQLWFRISGSLSSALPPSKIVGIPKSRTERTNSGVRVWPRSSRMKASGFGDAPRDKESNASPIVMNP
jgi:hypothetical protein